MMMTHSYYVGDFDEFARSNHRAPATAYYDRAVPYTQQHDYYASPPQELRSEYGNRTGGPSARTMVLEQSPERVTNGNARRRIQVACSRCRRRKIKCTGDPGDGSGCSACRSAGGDRNTCAFIRVGSQPLSLPGVDMTPANDNVTTTGQPAISHGSDSTTSPYDSNNMYQAHSRPSLPVLHGPARTEYPPYDSYSTSPVDDYTFASSAYPRHQSVSSNYGTENFRPYASSSVTGAMPSGMYYEPGAAFSFGAIQAAGPFPSTSLSRLPSVTAESFTPLNMGSLHSSLPTQTVQERRLPVPYNQNYQPGNYTNMEVPQIRPLAPLSEPQNRLHISGAYNRSGMSWSADSTHDPATSRSTSVSAMPAVRSHELPIPSSRSSTSSVMGEPLIGYRFSATSASPGASPTTIRAPSDNPSSTSTSLTTSAMLPPSNMRYINGNPHSGLRALTPNDDTRPRSSSSREAAASLYSFSTGVDTSDRSGSDQHHVAPSTTEDGQLQLSVTPQRNYPALQQSQPQHAASVDELRHRSSHDQRAATAHRMSVSNLNAR